MTDTLSIVVINRDRLGHSAATHFVRADHRVWLAQPREPDPARGVAKGPGFSAEAATVADAVRAAEIVLLAVPWKNRFAAIQEAGGETAFEGKS